MKKITIKEKVQRLVNFWNATECKYCNGTGYKNYGKPHFLDCNGTLVEITGEPGKLQHVYDDYFWSCQKEKGKHMRPIGEVEAKAYIQVWGRED